MVGVSHPMFKRKEGRPFASGLAIGLATGSALFGLALNWLFAFASALRFGQEVLVAVILVFTVGRLLTHRSFGWNRQTPKLWVDRLHHRPFLLGTLYGFDLGLVVTTIIVSPVLLPIIATTSAFEPDAVSWLRRICLCALGIDNPTSLH